MYHKPRKEKIIGHIALGCDLFIYSLTVGCVDLGQEGEVIFIGYTPYPFQHIPGFGFIKKVRAPGCFGSVGKGIKTDDLCAISCEGLKGIAVEIPDKSGPYIKIHLPEIRYSRFFHQLTVRCIIAKHFLIEGIPIGYLTAVGHFYHKKGKPRLSEEHILKIFIIRLYIAFGGHFPAACPELIPVDEEIRIFRILTLFKQILKLGGEDGSMIKYKIKL